MPWNVNGNATAPMLPDGEPADLVLVDGVVVYRSEIVIDDFERSGLGYNIFDSGQSTLPHITTSQSWEDNRSSTHGSASNAWTNLAPDNPGYSSSTQTVLDNYAYPGDVMELYFRVTSWTTGSPQFRIGFLTNGYYNTPSHIRLRFTPGFWRMETGSSLYGGDSSASGNPNLTSGDWHRLVIDMTSFPTISAYIWNAETGSFGDSIQGTDSSPAATNAGHYFWCNADVNFWADYLNIIDESDYDAGNPL